MQFAFNILGVSGSAMFAGAMLTIGVTLGGYWKSLPPSEFLDWFGQNVRFIMRVIPFVLVPALVGLGGSLWLGWAEANARLLWSAAIACILAVLALTIVWFVPANAAFASKSIPLDQAPARLNAWLIVHSVRIALALAGSALSVLAISR
jgi:uncharacterized membrane protein